MSGECWVQFESWCCSLTTGLCILFSKQLSLLIAKKRSFHSISQTLLFEDCVFGVTPVKNSSDLSIHVGLFDILEITSLYFNRPQPQPLRVPFTRASIDTPVLIYVNGRGCKRWSLVAALANRYEGGSYTHSWWPGYRCSRVNSSCFIK